MAQYTGDGYYRVHNKATSRYIYVLDNTGSIDYSRGSADMGAVELHKDTARLHYDPACIIYAHEVSAGSYDLKAQGTGVHDIIGYYVNVYQKSDGSYQVYAEGQYLDDDETSARDLGFLGTLRNGDYRCWYINRLNNTDQYFGLLPTVQLGSKYYKPFYASFPFTCASAGMKIYYISKVYQSAAILSEVTGTIPAATPVFIECAAPNPWKNRLTIGGTATASAPGNQLRGVYFNNPNRRKSHDARTAFNPATMRVLSVSPDGKLCYTKSSITYLPANESYLNVPTTAADTLFVMTEAEYEVYSKASSISLNIHTLDLYPEQTAALTASILPTTAVVTTVNWTSSNPAVATADADGNISALAVGTTLITASTTDGTNLSDTCRINVHPIIATGLSLSRGLFSGIAGDTATLTASFVPANTTNRGLVWNSTNPAVATVSDNGFVTIHSVGMATVTATTVDGSDISASCSVIGNAVKVTGIRLYTPTGQALDSLRTGDNFTLCAKALPDNATSKAITWQSQQTSGIRIISQTDTTCVCQALSAGDFVITATAGDGSGVSADTSVTVLPTLAESLALSQDTVRLSLGDVIRYSYTLLPAETTDKSVRWSSSDTTVVSVTQQGYCFAVGVGEAIITLSTLDGSNLTATSVIQVADTVVPPTLASSLALSQHEVTLLLGDSLTLSYTLLPLETTDPSVGWYCSDTTVIAFDPIEGTCRATALGSAYIVIYSLDGSNLTDTCFFTVNPILAEQLTVSPSEATLHVGDTLSLSYILLPLNTTNPAVIWLSSDTSVVSIDSLGRCMALTLGTATLTVATLDGSNLSASCAVMVTPVLADSIAISLTELTLTIGDSALLSAQVFPANVTNAGVLFTSSAPAVVSIDATGTVHALGVGEAVITVSTADGTNLTDSCLVTVEPVYVTDIILSTDSFWIYEEASATVTATVLPEDATFRRVEWSSSDSTVLAVTQEGRVTGLKPGVAYILVSATDGSGIAASCLVEVKLWTSLTEILASDPDQLLIYDILGRRLSSIPASGLYIINGKMTYIVR